DAHRADRRLEAGELGIDDIHRLATTVAAFHARARCDDETGRYGQVDAIRKNVRENFAQTRSTIEGYLSPEECQEVEAWQLEVLGETARFDARIAAQRVRDGHGDLRLEHVYFQPDGSLAIIDCIEFNERFRFADVCADIAFLSMDLAWHGRADLAEHFLARYAHETDDYDLYSVVNFYESYRAFVRGKVALLLARDTAASDASRERARREARRYFLLSLAFERPPLEPPRLVAVGGMIASGKSTVAAYAGSLLAAPVLSSDRTRKHMAGARPTDSIESEAWSGNYADSATQRVYAELCRRAEVILESGRPVVVDASFRSQGLRATIRAVAERQGVPFVFIEASAPRDIRRTRLLARDRGGTHESDARADLLDTFAAHYEPVDPSEAETLLRVDTSHPQSDTQRRIQAAVTSD
ncbi:MAG: AAA family ATPase, partial [Polyangiales bacterium]